MKTSENSRFCRASHRQGQLPSSVADWQGQKTCQLWQRQRLREACIAEMLREPNVSRIELVAIHYAMKSRFDASYSEERIVLGEIQTRGETHSDW